MTLPSAPHLTIGKLSAATGVKVPTIRFYEQAGLLPEPPRTASDRRLYDEPALRRLGGVLLHAFDAGAAQRQRNEAIQRSIVIQHQHQHQALGSFVRAIIHRSNLTDLRLVRLYPAHNYDS